MMGGGYGGGYGGGQGSGGVGGGNGQGTETQGQPPPEAQGLGVALRAAGVPNDDGQIRWPIGLQAIATPGADEVREQLDALLQLAAYQSLTGPVNPEVAQEMGRAIRKLRRLLLKDETERFGLSRFAYDEARKFLDKLERAENMLAASLAPAGGPELRTNVPSAPPTPEKPAPDQKQDQQKKDEGEAKDGK
jgi:hypothetical protein